ncbi:hypothetical protein WFJ45_24140, partial [Salmonella enterica subsp. enterica serovar Minnesota]|uniref:hypothetical protein n=1 Tax=Salmonella enterica TaxID=28901 RepID=UPI003D267AF7
KNINEPTAELQAKKDEGTFRTRPDQIRLNGLPPAQQDLSGRIDALTEDLANIGCVAFVYANKQVKTGMDTVHGRLGENDTGRAT